MSVLLFKADVFMNVFTMLETIQVWVIGVFLVALGLGNNPGRILSMLKGAGILTPDNRIIVEQHADILMLRISVDNLYRAGILTQENFNIVAQDSNLFVPLYNLNEAHLLSQANFNILVSHRQLRHVLNKIKMMHLEGVLSQETFDAVITHTDKDNLVTLFITLKTAGILTTNNINILNTYDKLYFFGKGLMNLYNAGILTQQHFDYLHSSDKTKALATAFIVLHQAGILIPQNIDVLVRHPTQEQIAPILVDLKDSGILGQQNFDVVTQHHNIVALSCPIYMLNRAGILTQASFSNLLDQSHQVLLDPVIADVLWTRLSESHIAAHWEAILNAAIQPNPLYAIRGLVQTIFGEHEAQAQVELNDRQSTHTASVHRTVSDSAANLFRRYGADIDAEKLDGIIAEIGEWVASLSDDLIHDAAKRAFARLAEPYYSYTDEVSDVSTRQLLALSWLAIHHEDLREGSLDDAYAQVAEGLYECQRGYNISDAGHDLGGIDEPICTAGTFNKLVEKLAGIHPDVVVQFITPKTAGLKLAKLVKAAVYDYLETISHPSTVAGFLSTSRLLKLVEKEGMAPIWPFIKSKVTAQLFDEFGSLYTSRFDQRFLDLIDVGVDVELGELPSVQRALANSNGYHAYCLSVFRSSNLFFKMMRTQSHEHHQDQGFMPIGKG